MSIVHRVRNFFNPQPSPTVKFLDGVSRIFNDAIQHNPEGLGMLVETAGGLAKATLIVGSTVAKHGSTMLAELAERASVWIQRSDEEAERAVQSMRASEATWAKISAFDTAAEIKAFEANEADHVQHHQKMHDLKRLIEYNELMAKALASERAREAQRARAT